jgi:hypothetical protein
LIEEGVSGREEVDRSSRGEEELNEGDDRDVGSFCWRGLDDLSAL